MHYFINIVTYIKCFHEPKQIIGTSTMHDVSLPGVKQVYRTTIHVVTTTTLHHGESWLVHVFVAICVASSYSSSANTTVLRSHGTQVQQQATTAAHLLYTRQLLYNCHEQTRLLGVHWQTRMSRLHESHCPLA